MQTTLYREEMSHNVPFFGDCTVDNDDILKDLDEILDCLRTETAKDIAITSSVSKVKQSAQ